MSSIHRLERKQLLPCSLSEAWSFFSDPRNLKVITPDHMGFHIIGDAPGQMYAGQLIQYTVKPVMNWPFTWLTEITQVQAPSFFIDEQRLGPYRLWHHQHHFRETPQGVEMHDIVHYVLPYGWLGNLLHPLIRKKLERIFDYRVDKVKQLFPVRPMVV